MGTPKYYQIENLLRDEIEGGSFEPGDRFYSNAELIERFGVSSITVIRAVGDLVSEGLLVRQQGKGTFVSHSRSRRRRPVLMSEIEVYSGQDEGERTTVLSLERVSGPARDEGVVSTLGLDEGGGYCVIERVRSFRGVPFQFQTSYIPARFIRQDVEPSYYASIYRRFREDFGIRLSREASQEFVRVCLDVPERVRSCLGIEPGTPCVHKNHTTTLPSGEVAEYIEMYKRWDYFEMMIEEVAR
ncbi:MULTISPECIES: GntR family transcriptional regulator [Atopobiaceae]|uniref:GntR family transcriptional regulator n=1 Tax=Atopobiaceae TaxID=1643824 RepID=UPI002A90B886|nr:GntR family transcriptional regulator [Tractidigestivibacter sp.]MDD7584321.1 GntR family transcriptional regulator [Coriobacteriaceae bacterium]MDY5272318.1 GntR family transcriptional regulator [Tractidigestivibacter sp.]